MNAAILGAYFSVAVVLIAVIALILVANLYFQRRVEAIQGFFQRMEDVEHRVKSLEDKPDASAENLLPMRQRLEEVESLCRVHRLAIDNMEDALRRVINKQVAQFREDTRRAERAAAAAPEPATPEKINQDALAEAIKNGQAFPMPSSAPGSGKPARIFGKFT
ncbi:MAG: hypothetical protein ACREH5_06215 [Candidatus Omnitrophota bacterium]